ncbi:hypothetical protein BDZ89DRAFT_1131390 [Hymenopellis radicata]|nr:hypothetical protein BDZ89DRAFT_1131390 [Hymenopellis radicata]
MSYYANRATLMRNLMNTVDARAIYKRYKIVRRMLYSRSSQPILLQRIEIQKPTWVIERELVRRLPFPNHSPIAHSDEEARQSCPFCRANKAVPFVMEARYTVQ